MQRALDFPQLLGIYSIDSIDAVQKFISASSVFPPMRCGGTLAAASFLPNRMESFVNVSGLALNRWLMTQTEESEPQKEEDCMADELYPAPRNWAEKACPKLIHYNRLPKR